MIVGNASQWDDTFQQNLLPLIFDLIITVWKDMKKPVPTDLEDDISDKLYCALLNSKNRSEHPFLIRREDREYDLEQAKEIGRKDIVFFPSYDENIYLCLEAKRLNAQIGGKCHSLADQYVKEGMQRFVNLKYASDVSHGAMLGYVLDGKIGNAMKNVENNIRKRFAELRMENDGGFMLSTIRPEDNHTKETRHNRDSKHIAFSIHHLFVTNDKKLKE
jgi:hypothetical protein